MAFEGKIVFLGLASIFAALGVYLYRSKKKEIVPWRWREVGKLTKLNLYPLKSGHRIELSHAECTEFGLRQTPEDGKLHQLRDRCLVVYAEKDNEFRTARTYPKMVLIDVSVHDDRYLGVDAPTMRTLYVEIPDKIDKKESIVRLHHGEEIYTIDCGDEAASWISRYILEKESGLRLGYHDASVRRDITRTHKRIMDYYTNLSNSSTGLYSDLASVLFVNQSSVRDLNKRIGNSSVTVDNFRPNVVVDGPDIEPYAEDNWEWIKVGNVVFRNVKECTRCVMTTINPENAARSLDREPLKTLETFRMSNGPNKLPVMGVNCEVRKPGIIKLGDPVYVAETEKQ
ncbi:mitochondrial amidoxime-reducing component 1-like [Cylas formicarius]|uniref:mitochondrial amidoxime-reducing component 1-like n=1 Tax=Cylas formicarius TaxID=197179 RepID=UPI002958BB66|nr:mitochondrial amidoxime-reducing component 1-like [Cylas formicarius]XP_060530859.1 mitochondrial amidoxime-reducing component 1-like [Cylas formicarius]